MVIDNKTTAVVQFNVGEVFGSKSQYIFFNMKTFKETDMTFLTKT